MERGEWWIDESGQLTFADGDIGDYNHEAVAYCAALGLPLGPDDGDYDGPDFAIGERVFQMHPGDLGEDYEGKPIPITTKNSLYKWLKANGAQQSALTFFGREHADAREYAVRYMDWIRVKIGSSVDVDVAVLNESVLSRPRNADFWGDDPEHEIPAKTSVFINVIGKRRRPNRASGVGAGTEKYMTVGELLGYAEPDEPESEPDVHLDLSGIRIWR